MNRWRREAERLCGDAWVELILRVVLALALLCAGVRLALSPPSPGWGTLTETRIIVRSPLGDFWYASPEAMAELPTVRRQVGDFVVQCGWNIPDGLCLRDAVDLSVPDRFPAANLDDLRAQAEKVAPRIPLDVLTAAFAQYPTTKPSQGYFRLRASRPRIWWLKVVWAGAVGVAGCGALLAGWWSLRQAPLVFRLVRWTHGTGGSCLTCRYPMERFAARCPECGNTALSVERRRGLRRPSRRFLGWVMRRR